MHHLRILLDLDGTVAQNAGRKIAAEHFGVNLDEESGLSLPERLGLTVEEFWAWWHTNQEEIYERAVPLPGAAAVLRSLKQAGATIVVVTARRSDAQAVTCSWLARHDFPWDEMILNADDKVSIAQEQKLNLGFEDDPANAIPLADLMPMVLVGGHKNRSQAIEHPQIYRVSGWDEVPALLHLLTARTA